MNTKQFFTSLRSLATDSQAFIQSNKSNLFTTGAALLVITNLVVIKGVLSALHAIPLLPSVMELVGVGYSVWFSARFLYSKSGRSELVDTFKGIRAEVLGGSTDDSDTSIITECDIPSTPSLVTQDFTDAHQELAMIELLQERGYKVYTQEECTAMEDAIHYL